MLIPDVNVLVDAWRAESARHRSARRWLEASLESEGIGLVDSVATGFVRVMTMPVRGLDMPLTEVLEAIDELRHAPGTTALTSGRSQWATFVGLCTALKARGNLVPDAYLASIAIDCGAVLVSGDHFFSRVPGLDWMDLPAA